MAKIKTAVLLLLIVGVSLISSLGFSHWSNPTNNDGSEITWEEPTPKPHKEVITHEEYSQIFDDFRNHIITREQALQKLKGVSRE